MEEGEDADAEGDEEEEEGDDDDHCDLQSDEGSEDEDGQGAEEEQVGAEEPPAEIEEQKKAAQEAARAELPYTFTGNSHMIVMNSPDLLLMHASVLKTSLFRGQRLV